MVMGQDLGSPGRFLSRLRGLSLVERWNFHYRTTRETVAEHSFWVAIYSMIIADLQNEIAPPFTVNWESLLRHALLHDAEEAVTGDCPMLVKRECKDAWRDVAHTGLRQLVKYLPSNMHDKYLVHYASMDNVSAQVVKAADLLDVVMYAVHEKKHGNYSYVDISHEAVAVLRGMGLEAVDRILDEMGFNEGMDPCKEMTHL